MHKNGGDCPTCLDKLKQVDAQLCNWFTGALKSYPNLHVAWGYRDEKSQNQAVANGESKLLWPHSLHNQTPAQAIDLFILDEGEAFFPVAVYADLAKNHMPHSMRWGGDFLHLKDYDHFELTLHTPHNP